LTQLTVSQFISFGLYSAAFLVAIGKYDSSAGLGLIKTNLSELLRYSILFVVVMLNGLRFYLSNWEVEEDKKFRDLKEEYKNGWVHWEWFLRAACLLCVYLIPICLTKRGEYVEVLLVILFGTLFVWDSIVIRKMKIDSQKNPGAIITDLDVATFWITERALEKMRSERVPDHVLEQLGRIKRKIRGEEKFLKTLTTTIGKNQITEHKTTILKYALDPIPSFWDVLAAGSRRTGKLTYFLQKLVFWRAAEGVGLLVTVLYLGAAFFLSQKYAEGFTFSIGILSFVYFIIFGVEFILNLKDYWVRTLWCIAISVLFYLILPVIGTF
jgi:hypothetical protein